MIVCRKHYQNLFLEFILVIFNFEKKGLKMAKMAKIAQTRGNHHTFWVISQLSPRFTTCNFFLSFPYELSSQNIKTEVWPLLTFWVISDLSKFLIWFSTFSQSAAVMVRVLTSQISFFYRYLYSICRNTFYLKKK